MWIATLDIVERNVKLLDWLWALPLRGSCSEAERLVVRHEGDRSQNVPRRGRLTERVSSYLAGFDDKLARDRIAGSLAGEAHGFDRETARLASRS
jgi:hypothetical protein